MKKNEYNPIGIESQLDWPRIRKLLFIGLFAGCLVFIGDWILGYGVKDSGLGGLEGKLLTYTGKSDSVYF